MAQHISGVYLMLEGNNSEIDAVQYNREPTWSIDNPSNNALRYKDESGAAHYLYEFMTMNDLTDVDLTGISAGDLVIWDGTSFVPISSGSFGGTQNLSEVLTIGNDATQQDIINVNSISGDDGLIELNELGSLNVFSPADGNINLYAQYHMYINSKNTAIIDATWANGISEPYYYYATMPNTTISGILYAGEKSIVTKEFLDYSIANIPSGTIQDLQSVTDVNNSTTNPIIVNSTGASPYAIMINNGGVITDSERDGTGSLYITNDETSSLPNSGAYIGIEDKTINIRNNGINGGYLTMNNSTGIIVESQSGTPSINYGKLELSDSIINLKYYDIINSRNYGISADVNSVSLIHSNGGLILDNIKATFNSRTAGLDPIDIDDYTTKNYVDAAVSGILPAPVDSVFSRTGAVVAENGDYNASQITANSTSDVQTELNKKIETLAGTGQGDLPTSPDDGMIYYDKALRYPLWYDANTAHWVNSTGAIVY